MRQADNESAGATSPAGDPTSGTLTSQQAESDEPGAVDDAAAEASDDGTPTEAGPDPDATTELPQVDETDAPDAGTQAEGDDGTDAEQSEAVDDDRSAPAAADDDLPVTTELPQVDAPPPGLAPADIPPFGPPEPSFGPPAPSDAAPAGPPPIAPPPVAPSRPGYGRDEADRRRPPGDREPQRSRPGPIAERPRHFRTDHGPERPPADREASRDDLQRRLVVAAMLAPAAVLVLLFLGWAVDALVHSGQVVRNVEVAGRPIGGVDESELPDLVAGIGDDVAGRTVRIQVADEAAAGRSVGAPQVTYEAKARDLGLAVDERATVDAALDAGRDTPLPLRPFTWAASLFSTHEVDLEYEVSEAQTTGALQMLQGAQLTTPTEPTIQLGDEGFVSVPGRPGTGLDPAEVADELLAAAEGEPEGGMTITAHATDIQPHFTDADAEALATRANDVTANGITLKAGDFSVPVPAQQLRQWITPVDTDEGGQRRLDLVFNTQAAQDALPFLFAGMAAEPTNASVRLEGGRPVVVPGQNSTRCKCDDGGARIWETLQAGQRELQFDAEVVEPEHTTQEVESWGIREPIGGSRAHRNGADVGGPGPGYTTFYDPGAPRVTNIQRIADLVNGVVIAPGESFSVNDHVGPRTAGKGFVMAGAIRDGLHVEEIGGGVSQFFTTLFNAAYFGGLDIDEYQAHTENFTRYPDGREATGGHPNPDLVITNNTPFGVLIATSHSGTSVTVTLWSTPYIQAEQSGLTTGRSGNCTVATSTRTRRWPDGRTDTDSFSATYRPGEGQFCQ